MNAENEKKMIEEALKKSLSSLAGSFKKDELAYLALTSKIELPLRDRWAFSLYERLFPLDYIVAREWEPQIKTLPGKKRPRIDMAILNRKQQPIALVEIKAMYSFDAFGGLQKYLERIKNDKKKLINVNGETKAASSLYVVLFATHPQCEIPEEYRREEKTIKYWENINKEIERQGNVELLKKKVQKNISDGLEDIIVNDKYELEAGSAFGVKTSVLYWIMRAN